MVMATEQGGQHMGKADIIFRQALAEDAAECVRVRGLTRENAASAERLAELGVTVASWGEQIRSGQLPGHLALHKGQLVGYCFGDLGSGEVVVLALLPEFEGMGLGKVLLHKVMAELRSHGHQRLFLGCSDDPASRSYGFYRHLGWRSTGQRDGLGDEMLEHVLN